MEPSRPPFRPPYDFKQILEGFDVTARLRRVAPPRVKPMAAYEDAVGRRMLCQRLLDCLCPAAPVLRVRHDRQHLAMRMARLTSEGLQHLEHFARTRAVASRPERRAYRLRMGP